jgi:3-hydroxyisobutyrate dehydrogenase-like beta-hydroxyacid dehydrogenase
MSGVPQNLYYVDSDIGSASSINLINQLLTGIHISVAAEAMAFGSKLGLDTQSLYDIIKTAAGGSWAFENRVPEILAANWTAHPMLASFVKDLGIVLDESKKLRYPTVMGAAAHQLYLMGASCGWSREADGGIARLWELMTGVSVAKSARLDLP